MPGKKVGRNLKLDEGIGTCGKDSQSVPISVGIGTVELRDLPPSLVGSQGCATRRPRAEYDYVELAHGGGYSQIRIAAQLHSLKIIDRTQINFSLTCI